MKQKKKTFMTSLIFLLLISMSMTTTFSVISDDFYNQPTLCLSQNMDNIDQSQILWNGAIAVSYPDMLAQEFKPNKNLLTRIHLLLYKTGNPQQNLTIAIRKDLNETDLINLSMQPTDIPDSRTWVELDFEDLSVTVDETYYIIWRPLEKNMTYLWWGYDNHNIDSYPRGQAWLNSQGTWTTENFVIKDWCFKTYGYHASQPPNTPEKPTGPTEGLSWRLYSYQTSSMDPEGDLLRYGWDWNGDDIVDEWTKYHPSATPINTTHSYNNAGTYHIKVKAEDEYGSQSSFSSPLTVNISNNPPYRPIAPQGPSYTFTLENNSFCTQTLDPENEDIRYGWDWNGDDIVDEWTKYHPSATPINTTHSYNNAGTYHIKVKAEDALGAQSGFSNASTITVINVDNDPPLQPNRPEGKTFGRIGISYSYRSLTSDPNGDRIYYQFDWDDGTKSQWVGPYNSSQIVSMSHIWSNKGSFQVKVKAKDEAGAESIWSDPLPLTMPVSYQQVFPYPIYNYLCALLSESLMKPFQSSIERGNNASRQL